MIRTLIVDDEPLARDGLRLRLAVEEDIELVGEAADGDAAVRLATTLLPDLMLLDVQMPGISGVDVVEQIAPVHMPVLVFVTAYDRYAIRAFEIHAVDYLLKPFTAERFADALRRARRELAQREEEEGSSRVGALLAGPEEERYLSRLAVRSGDRFLLVKTEEIDWMEAAANYVEVHCGGKHHLVRTTMGKLEQKLDPARFARIHRSTIVNIDRVVQIRSDAHGDYDVTLVNGRTLRMTRSFSSRLLKKV
jgi:two-component system LytT family response regulator